MNATKRKFPDNFFSCLSGLAKKSTMGSGLPTSIPIAPQEGAPTGILVSAAIPIRA